MGRTSVDWLFGLGLRLEREDAAAGGVEDHAKQDGACARAGYDEPAGNVPFRGFLAPECAGECCEGEYDCGYCQRQRPAGECRIVGGIDERVRRMGGIVAIPHGDERVLAGRHGDCIANGSKRAKSA